MIETICKSCGARYPLSTEHVCPKAKRGAAKKLAGPLLYASRSASTDIVGKERPKSVKKSPPAILAKAEAAAAHLAPKRKDTRKGDRHKPGYWADYQRKRRAKAKEQK